MMMKQNGDAFTGLLSFKIKLHIIRLIGSGSELSKMDLDQNRFMVLLSFIIPVLGFYWTVLGPERSPKRTIF